MLPKTPSSNFSVENTLLDEDNHEEDELLASLTSSQILVQSESTQQDHALTDNSSQGDLLCPTITSPRISHNAKFEGDSRCHTPDGLWQHPLSEDNADEKTELLWKGHLTKFKLSNLKQFQLDAICTIEKNKDDIIVQKTGSEKSLCYQLPSLFNKKRTVVVICPTISLINSQVESLKDHNLHAIAASANFEFDEDQAFSF